MTDEADPEGHPTSPLAAIVGFVPWIVYWILLGSSSFRTAITVAFGLSVLLVVVGMIRHKPPKVLELGTLIAFALLLVVTFATNDQFLERWIQPLTNGALLLVVLGSIAIKRPFTLQYAREAVTPEVAAMPGFLYINRIMTWVWAAAFAVMTASSAIPPIVQGEATIKDGGSTLSIIFYWVVPFTALGLTGLFTSWFPDWFTKSIDAIGAPPDAGTTAPAPAPVERPAAEGAALAVDPPRGLLDDPLVVRVAGVPSGSRVTLAATTVDVMGQQWRSEATFDARPDGTVDTSVDPARAGTWSGVDPGGLVWSMQVPEAEAADIYYPSLGPVDIAVTAETDEVGRLAVTTSRSAAGDGVAVTDVHDGSLVGRLHLPAGPGPHPAVALYPGSEGGLDSQSSNAALLASHGYAALVVAPFGADVGLEPAAVEIPLERFHAGIEWLGRHKQVAAGRVATLSISKGSEALLAALAEWPELVPKAVVLVSPSSHVWQAVGDDGPVVGTSSWTSGGRPVPYRDLDVDAGMRDLLKESFLAGHRRRHHQPTLMHLASSYALPGDPASEPSTIRSERIAAPILCLSGASDELWPSSPMAAALLGRRSDAGVEPGDESHEYPEAGHLLRMGLMPTQALWTSGIAFGGSAEGLARAQADLGPRILAFLAHHV